MFNTSQEFCLKFNYAHANVLVMTSEAAVLNTG